MIDKILKEGVKHLEARAAAFSNIAFDAGGSPQLTRRYLDSLQMEWRFIDAVEAATDYELFGQRFKTPVMVAALSHLDGVHQNGMVEVARGALAAGAAMWVGIGGDDELKAVIDTGAKTLKIVKPYQDTDLIFKKLEAAERFGAFAVGMDTDFFFARKNGAAPLPMAPRTLEEMRGFIRATRLPFIFKGVLSVSDAAKAMEAGAAGIVVSHHGGSVMDGAVPPLRILPRIAKLINGRIPVLVDCGIVRGLDAFKAMALGGHGVLVGRAVMAGLAAGGADGVKEVLEGITWELRRALSLSGARDLRTIDPSVIWTPED